MQVGDVLLPEGPSIPRSATARHCGRRCQVTLRGWPCGYPCGQPKNHAGAHICTYHNENGHDDDDMTPSDPASEARRGLVDGSGVCTTIPNPDGAPHAGGPLTLQLQVINSVMKMGNQVHYLRVGTAHQHADVASRLRGPQSSRNSSLCARGYADMRSLLADADHNVRRATSLWAARADVASEWPVIASLAGNVKKPPKVCPWTHPPFTSLPLYIL